MVQSQATRGTIWGKALGLLNELKTLQGDGKHGRTLHPHKSVVPQEIESFPCTGNASLQLPVNVNMVVQGPPRFNDTRLHFKRNKICAKGISPEPNQSPAPAHAPSQGPALMSAAACALGLVLAVGLVASMMYVRARKQLRQDSLHTSFTTAGYGSHQNVFIRLDPLGRPPSATGSYATIASLNKYPTETKKLPQPTPYATALLPMGNQAGETIYSKPESVCPSRISYYASSQLTQATRSTPLPICGTHHTRPDDCSQGSSCVYVHIQIPTRATFPRR
ncbi:uncharacterized protein LOC115483382 [Drosophila hydei]|uniref:Uncharacterized protein LOC115483382 n=1 Tax=Drosophila hydei TaxID=7224 RepID=A0A6J2SXQ3_DROHY|nr:uncharacterized protein LOC115483382 [Drosophila hydei]